MENKKEKTEKPHFVDATYPQDEPWRTDLYFGPRDGSNSHAHIVASGAAVIFFRDMEGKEIINEFKKKKIE